jgi:AmpE protein
MSLIIILIALALERLASVGSYLQRFSWFDGYLHGLHKVFGSLLKGIVGVVIAILPCLLVVGLVYYGLGFLLFNIVGFFIALLVLLYCLGPVDLHTQLKTYLAESSQNNPQAGMLSNLDTLVKPSGINITLPRAITQGILVQFNERTFAVLFWFVLAGPLGALLYRLVSLIRHNALQENSENAALLQGATTIQGILDWLPARILSFTYALAGNFISGFAVWINKVWGSIYQNDELLLQSGLKALELPEDNISSASIEENKAALALTDRALIIFLVALGLVVLI